MKAPSSPNDEHSKLQTYLAFFELSPDLFCTADDSLHFVELNPAWTRVLGWTVEELRSKPFTEFVHPDDLVNTQREASRLLGESGVTLSFENRYRHKDGYWVPLSWAARVVNGTFFATAHDLSGKQARDDALAEREAELAESEARTRAILEGMVEGVVLQSSSGEVVTCNRAAEVILGLTRDQLLGRTSLDPGWHAIHEDGSPFPGHEHPAMVALKTGSPQTDVVMGVRRPDSAQTWISINARPLVRPGEFRPYAVIATFRDITEQKVSAKRTALMSRHERLVATGTLASGVGHEINNPLTYIISNLELAIEELSASGAGPTAEQRKNLVEMLVDARGGAEQIRKIVRGLKALATEDGPPVPTDVRATVETAINMAMHELRQRATVSIDMPPTGGLPPILASGPRLTQVLVHLLVNAAQAFTASDPAANKVVVRAVATGPNVYLAVADNGPGIAPNVLPRIFDPFFTTKPVGQGTGLGLSISHSIVSALGGELHCDTAVGLGSTFVMRLPAVVAPGDQFGSDNPLAAKRGRILIVDDDETVVRALQRSLKAEHDIVTELDPRLALRRLESGEAFDVIFCDLMMPYLTGSDLYRLSVAHSADLAKRFVFISGGVLRADIRNFLAEVPNQRVDKPVGVNTLRAIVRGFLDGTTSLAPNPTNAF